MRVCTLASGSSGNSLYIETGNTKLLVDAGISLRQIRLRLAILGVGVEELDAVVITHEHTDHTTAIKNLRVPVYVAEATEHLWQGAVQSLRSFASDSAFSIKEALITPFSVPHDALDPVGFTVECGGQKVGIATDIGTDTALVRERLTGVNILVLEFNHDKEIIPQSPYPWELKQRIQSRLGHLSNQQASELLGSLMHTGLRHVVLAHLSEVNNTPEAAYSAALSKVEKNGGVNTTITLAPRKQIGEVLEI